MGSIGRVDSHPAGTGACDFQFSSLWRQTSLLTPPSGVEGPCSPRTGTRVPRGNCATLELCVQSTYGLSGYRGVGPSLERSREVFQACAFLPASADPQGSYTKAHLHAYNNLSQVLT